MLAVFWPQDDHASRSTQKERSQVALLAAAHEWEEQNPGMTACRQTTPLAHELGVAAMPTISAELNSSTGCISPCGRLNVPRPFYLGSLCFFVSVLSTTTELSYRTCPASLCRIGCQVCIQMIAPHSQRFCVALAG
eukprot:2199658-Amphidinium_carterae.1